MIERQIFKLYERTRIELYRKIFNQVKERAGSLSAMEIISLEVIYALNRPTISEFARFIGISQSNATYKVNSLVTKGYITKETSSEDGREFILQPTEKFYGYSRFFEEDMMKMLAKVGENLTHEELSAVLKAVDLLEGEMDKKNPKE